MNPRSSRDIPPAEQLRSGRILPAKDTRRQSLRSDKIASTGLQESSTKRAETRAEESSSEESEEEDDKKKKGVQGMSEIENPNRVKQKFKKASEFDTDNKDGAAGGVSAKAKEAAQKPQLPRREKGEIDRAKAKAHYQKLHAQGKTDEARDDLARLAIIKKQTGQRGQGNVRT